MLAPPFGPPDFMGSTGGLHDDPLIGGTECLAEASQRGHEFRGAFFRDVLGSFHCNGANTGYQAGVAKSSDAHADVELALEQIDDARSLTRSTD